MKEIKFYRTVNDRCPVEEFLDSLTDKHAKRILWVLKLIKELKFIPKEYLKKLKSTDDIWEIRVKSGNNAFRILCFFENGTIIILTNGFVKKSQKTPKKEIALAEQRKKDYLGRKNNG